MAVIQGASGDFDFPSLVPRLADSLILRMAPFARRASTWVRSQIANFYAFAHESARACVVDMMTRTGPSVPYQVWKDTKDPVGLPISSPGRARLSSRLEGSLIVLDRQIPPPDKLPRLVPPTFVPPASLSAEETEAWYADLKTTWLGHACFLVEFPAEPTSGKQEGERRRGFRVLFDPVWSHRCSPSQCAALLVLHPPVRASLTRHADVLCGACTGVGPARVTKPPISLDEIPQVDAVVISHNHYDHLDVATLKHLYSAQPKGSLHFFVPLGNEKWMRDVIGVRKDEVSELDWWEERSLRRTDGGNQKDTASGPNLRVVCTPCQHVRRLSL